MQISISRLRTYLLCSQQYQFRYELDAPPEFQSSSLAFGSAMHHAIAEFHQSLNTISGEDMFAEFRKYWQAVVEGEAAVGRELRFKSDAEAELMDKAFVLCAAYPKTFKDVIPESPDDVELHFQVPLFDPQGGWGTLDHTLVGKIDLVANGSVYEFKTAARSASQKDADTSIQLTAYSMAFHYLFDEPPEQLKLVTLTTAKTPKIHILETRRQFRDYQHIVEMGMAIAKAIKAGVFFRNPEYLYGCHNCEHQDKCLGVHSPKDPQP